MQLFPHIKYVVDKFKHKLPKEDLKRYAKDVSLLIEPFIMPDLGHVLICASLPSIRSPRSSSTPTSKTIAWKIQRRSAKSNKRKSRPSARNSLTRLLRSTVLTSRGAEKQAKGGNSKADDMISGHNTVEDDVKLSDGEAEKVEENDNSMSSDPQGILKRKREDEMDIGEGAAEEAMKRQKSSTPIPPPPPPPPPLGDEEQPTPNGTGEDDFLAENGVSMLHSPGSAPTPPPPPPLSTEHSDNDEMGQSPSMSNHLLEQKSFPAPLGEEYEADSGKLSSNRIGIEGQV